MHSPLLHGRSTMQVMIMSVDTYQGGAWAFKAEQCRLAFVNVRSWCGDNFSEVTRSMYILKKADGEASVQFLPISSIGVLDRSFVAMSELSLQKLFVCSQSQKGHQVDHAIA